mgnify:CR=1 FL=1|jgi:3-phosphoshikimate 1-carboxyvinyltransferase
MTSRKFSVEITKQIPDFVKKINVDGDKSISIRACIIGSISQNVTKIDNILESEDVESSINCLEKLGVKIKKIKSKTYMVYGKGLGSLSAKKNQELNFGNSGTLARLLIGVLSTTPNIQLKMKGDSSLNKRSMKKLMHEMTKFGAEFFPKNKFNFPLRMISSDMPVGIDFKAGVSAQIKSAVILAGLNSYGNTNIIEKKLSRDHTENILLKSSNVIKLKKGKVRNIAVFGKKYLKGFNIKVPSDPSSAAFFTALTLLKEKSKIRINNVCLNPKRIGFYKILKKHGAKINFKNVKKVNNEIVGDIFVKSSKLKPIKANSEYYVSSTDEYPILFVIAALIPGVSTFKGISDLSNKESSRAKEMKKILDQIKIKSKTTNNEMKIFGNSNFVNKDFRIQVPNLGDHRICMSASILSLLTGVKAKIKNFETVKTSSPSFLDIIKYLGGQFEIKKIL